MNPKEVPARAEKPLSLNPVMAMGKKRFDELANIQSDLLEVIREANQNWLDRMQSEATLASEFSSKLTASHSIADTTAALPGMGETAHGVIHRRRPAPDV